MKRQERRENTSSQNIRGLHFSALLPFHGPLRGPVARTPYRTLPPVRACTVRPLWLWVISAGRRNTIDRGGSMGVRRPRMSWKERNELWRRWRAGESLVEIAKAIDRERT